MESLVDIYRSMVKELLALSSASGPPSRMHGHGQACMGAHVCVRAHTACTRARTHLCTPVLPADEKQESVLGSIPLLSFRVAAVQPSDNISRKHTFKVSWASSSRREKEGIRSARTRGWSRVKYTSLRTPCVVAQKVVTLRLIREAK